MVLTSAQTFPLSPPLIRPSLPSVTAPSHCFAISPRKSHAFFDAARYLSNHRGSYVVGGTTRMVARASVSQYSGHIAEDVGDVSIFTAAGEPVMFKDLWAQNEVSIVRPVE